MEPKMSYSDAVKRTRKDKDQENVPELVDYSQFSMFPNYPPFTTAEMMHDISGHLV